MATVSLWRSHLVAKRKNVSHFLPVVNERFHSVVYVRSFFSMNWQGTFIEDVADRVHFDYSPTNTVRILALIRRVFQLQFR